jgi:hypothetical protein
MPDPKDTNQKTPENRPDAETPKKAAKVTSRQGKPDTKPNEVPRPQVQEHKEPEKKSA